MAGFFIAHATERSTPGITSKSCPMTPRFTCCCSQSGSLHYELNPETFKRWLAGDIHDLGSPEIKNLMIEWLKPLLTQDEDDRLVGWHLDLYRGQQLVINPLLLPLTHLEGLTEQQEKDL